MSNNDIESSEVISAFTGVENEKIGVSLLMAIVMAFLAAIISVAFYHYVLAPKPVKFGLLDIQSISSTLENDARQAIVENVNATDADRNAAASEFETKMKSLQAVVAKVGTDCNCVLLVKAAMLNTRNAQAVAMVDYTNSVREQMGLQYSVPASATAKPVTPNANAENPAVAAPSATTEKPATNVPTN